MGPDYRNRSANEILSQHIYNDSIGFGFRAASWIDYIERTGNVAALFYACIDCRLSIEHLMFELIVVCSEPRLTKEDYQRCLATPRKLEKLIKTFIPDYERLVIFSKIVQEMTPNVPKINVWEINNIMKDWGHLSGYLHWTGAAFETTDNSGWQCQAFSHAKSVIIPHWEKLNSGMTGSMSIESMSKNTREVWEQFRKGEIESGSIRFKLEMLEP